MIEVRGPNVFKGYWRMPEKTAAELRDNGFFITGDLGKMLNLDNKWAYNIIKQNGNYGELFERNLGEKTRLGLSRGPNQLWTKGGLLYAPPFR